MSGPGRKSESRADTPAKHALSKHGRSVLREKYAHHAARLSGTKIDQLPDQPRRSHVVELQARMKTRHLRAGDSEAAGGEENLANRADNRAARAPYPKSHRRQSLRVEWTRCARRAE